MLKNLGFGALVLLGLLAIEAIILMLMSGQIINTASAPVLANLDFLWLLIKNNPWSGLLELLSQPVLIIGHVSPLKNDFSDALYFYPVGSLLHLLTAMLIGAYLINKPHKRVKGIVIGLLLLLVALPNFWLASCCGDTPDWLLDTALRLYVFAEGSNPLERLSFYETILPLLFPARVLLGAVGLILVLRYQRG